MRHSRRSCLAAAALALTAGGAAARPSAEVLAFGRVEGERAATPPGEGGSGLAPARPISRTRFLDHSDTVEARLCRSFGVMLRVTPGPGEAEPTALQVRVLHPVFSNPDGATSAEDDFDTAVVFGHSHVGFTFDHDWELRPGDWTVAVYARGVPVATKRFHVVAPPAGAPTSDCGGEVS